MESKTGSGISIDKSRSAMKTIYFNTDEELTHHDRKLTLVASKAIQRFDKKGISNFSRLPIETASTFISAYLGFRDLKKKRIEYLIPKDKAAWLECLVFVAKKRVHVECLPEKELRDIVIRARSLNFSTNKTERNKKSQEPVVDPALPRCYNWDKNQVGDWIAAIGWPQFRETFVRNYITGRHLVLVDCNALNKMGMTDLDIMLDIARKIRELLGIPPPNALRPIMRITPYEHFLRRKAYNGQNYDEMTFKQFCEIEGFDYEYLAGNKNAQIGCTCEEVIITTPEKVEPDDDEDGEDFSLKDAPTVEYLVRNAIIRDKIIDKVMKDLLETVYLPLHKRKYGKEIWGTLKREIGGYYDDLHLHYPQDRLKFASGVAHQLIDELYKTVAILNDISQLEKHIKEKISLENRKRFQDGARVLMEEATSIASLLALGELDLESIFRTEPTFQHFIEDISKDAEKDTNDLVPDANSVLEDVFHEAEKKTNELVPGASLFVDEVLSAAYKLIHKKELAKSNPKLKTEESIKREPVEDDIVFILKPGEKQKNPEWPHHSVDVVKMSGHRKKSSGDHHPQKRRSGMVEKGTSNQKIMEHKAGTQGTPRDKTTQTPNTARKRKTKY